MTASKHGWHVPSDHTTAVDLVGHAWFLPTEWVHFLFAQMSGRTERHHDSTMTTAIARVLPQPDARP